MTYVAAALGSSGDLHPFLAVARALREQGEPVVFLSQENHRAEIEAQGLTFHAILSREAYEKTSQHPSLWHPIRGFGVLWRHMAVPAMEPTYAYLKQLCAHSSTPVRVLASPLMVGARLAREHLPLRLITAHLAPAGLRSCQDPMFLGAHKVPHWVPHAVRQWVWAALDRYKLEPMAAPRLNAWRKHHGLPALKEPVFKRWIHSPDKVIGLFPPDFGQQPTDWPCEVTPLGFPLYQAHPPTHSAVNNTLTAFIHTHTSAPLAVFFPGSAALQQPPSHIRLIQELLSQGFRCLLLGKAFQNFEGPKEKCHHEHWADLNYILPHAQVFIHHGGIGCCAQGLQAQVFQVIVPAAYDQHDNGQRIADMQAGMWRPAQHISATMIMHQLAQRNVKYSPKGAWACSFPNRPNAAVMAICETWRAV